jgi:hypothetical protein
MNYGRAVLLKQIQNKDQVHIKSIVMVLSSKVPKEPLFPIWSQTENASARQLYHAKKLK